MIVLPLFIIPTKITGKRRWKIASDIQKKHDESNQILNETMGVSGQMLVKLFGREEDEYVSLLTRLHRPVDDLLNINVDVTRSLALFERLFEYFDKQPDITDREGCIEAARLKGEVFYENVSFSYRPDAPVLEDISFRVEPGRRLLSWAAPAPEKPR